MPFTTDIKKNYEKWKARYRMDIQIGTAECCSLPERVTKLEKSLSHSYSL